MKVIEACCSVITNMEVLVLLMQQQQQLPSVETLLRSASRPAEHGESRTQQSSGSAPNDESGKRHDSGERFKLDHVKDLLYQHMFNQMVQDYIRKTCPYLHLVRAPDPPVPTEKLRSVMRRSCGSLTHSRRSSLISRQSGLSLVSVHILECIDVLSRKYKIAEAELLMILNLGAFREVEMYAILDECSNRFTESDVGCMLSLLDIGLIQQQKLPSHLVESSPYLEDRGAASAVSNDAEEGMVCDTDVPSSGHQGLHRDTVEIEQQQQSDSVENSEEMQVCKGTVGNDTVASESATMPVAHERSANVRKSTDKSVDKSTKLPRTTAVAKRRVVSRRRRILDD